MKILRAEINDIPELYHLQLLAFESEAIMIGSRNIPALLETAGEFAEDFTNWNVLKLIGDSDAIFGAIRYRKNGDVVEVGRLMIHPEYRQQGLAQKLLSKVDSVCPNETKELYTCKKSWRNICLYQKMGYTIFREYTEESGLSFVYMRKI